MKLSRNEIEIILNCLSIDLSIIENETGMDIDNLYDNINNITYVLSQVENGANYIEIM